MHLWLASWLTHVYTHTHTHTHVHSATGQTLRCDVFVDTIARIEITTRTRELLLEEEPERFELQAYDDEGVCVCVRARRVCVHVCACVRASVCVFACVCVVM